MGRRILGVALSCLLSSVALPAQTAPAGVVLQSASARLNANDAAAGSTIFDGDRMETQEKGALSLRSGQVQLTLSEQSTVWMNHENLILIPSLQRGTVTFRAETGTGVEIRADDVRVRPHFPVLTVGEVTLQDCDVFVTARTQSLEVTAGKETKILEEGKTYRVVRKGACATALSHPALPPIQSRFFLLPFAIATPIIIWRLREALESPDRP
ncbi:MAG TPA: hypothetical protein VFF95_03730 [Candidatus Binatus sp.]|nr:hypothetical protein [Candidatus Binatus sp.]